MYEPTMWVDDKSPDVNEDNLNKIEQGIKAAHDMAEHNAANIAAMAGNQMPEEYLKAAVDEYVNNNSAGFATQAGMAELDSKLSSEIVEENDANEASANFQKWYTDELTHSTDSPNNLANFNDTQELKELAYANIIGKHALYLKDRTSGSLNVYLTQNFEAGKKYLVIFDISDYIIPDGNASSSFNIRLYKGSSYIKELTNCAGQVTQWEFEATGEESIRIYSASYVKNVAIRHLYIGEKPISGIYNVFNNKKEYSVLASYGLVDSLGRVNGTDYVHTESLRVYKGDLITNQLGVDFYQVVGYYNNPTIGETSPDWVTTIQGKSYVSEHDGYITFNIVASHLSDGSELTLNINETIENRLGNIIPDINDIKDKLANSSGYGGTKVVTNIEKVVSVQKEVVETQIETIVSGRNASEFGVLPSNDGVTNTNNLQALLDIGGTIIVDVPGIYLFASGLKIGSNTTLIFGNQVYCKRADDDYKSLLINKGAFTKEYNDNIVIDGLYVICDGHYGTWQGTIHGLRGVISLYYVQNIKLRNIRCDDVAGHSYFIHLAKWENVLIENIHVAGNKDAIHVSTGNRLHIKDGWFQTDDDPVGLNAMDYVDGCPELGWIRNVVVENCVDASTKGTGYIARMLSGAWTDWKSGNQYRHADVVVNSEGNVYRMIKDPAVIEYMTSTEEPMHTTSADTTYSDGIKWRYIEGGFQYTASLENILFRDIYLKVRRTSAFFVASNNDSYCRAFYPNVVPPQVSNIRIKNVCCIGDISNLVTVQTPTDFISIKDSRIKCDTIFNFTKSGDYKFDNINKNTRVILSGNMVELKEDAETVDIIKNNVADRVVSADIFGNYKKGNFTTKIADSVTIVSNDL